MKLDIFGLTDKGLVRNKNEDAFVIADDKEKFDIEKMGVLLAVADGMGGHPLGEVASRIACEEILKYYQKEFSEEITPAQLIKHLTNTVFNVHAKIKIQSTQDLLRVNMGTTLSVMVIYKQKGLIVHVGDSRIYRLREGELVKLTKDHTMAQKLFELGQIDEDDSYENPLSHMLTQALGVELNQPFVKEIDIKPKDVFLLCSDGLYNMVSKEEIKKELEKDLSSKDICENLISLAIKGGGKDNITVIVAKIEDI